MKKANKRKFIWIFGVFGLVVLVGWWIFKEKKFIPKEKVNLPKEVEEKCGIENCHGLEIVCGPNVPEACTMEYQVGDFCRQYVSCGRVGGKCVLIKDKEFDICKSCVEKCKEENSEVGALFECEDKCREEVNKPKD